MRDNAGEQEAELHAEIRALQEENKRLREELAELATAVLAATDRPGGQAGLRSWADSAVN